MNYPLTALKILREKGYYKGSETLLKNTASMASAAKYLVESEPDIVSKVQNLQRMAIAVVQCYLRDKGLNPGKIDGYAGPMTAYAIDQWRGDVDYFVDDQAEARPIFPYQKDVPEFYGKMDSNQVHVHCPYGLYIAWDNKKTLQDFTCHEKVADSLTKAMELILKTYGNKIHGLGLDQWGGCLNPRLMRGSTTQWSMHSWGIAVDWFPQKNQWKWSRPRAVFSQPEYKDFFAIWESLGWVSLGRQKNYDWMHVQAARINP